MLTQILANILITAAIYLLVSMGLALVFSSSGFLNFTHGAVFATAPYLVLVLNAFLGMQLFIAVALGLLATVMLAALIEVGVFRRLRLRGSSSLVMLLASLGLYVVLQNALSLVFGDGTRSFRLMAWSDSYDIAGARVTLVQGVLLACAAMLAMAIHVLLRRSKLGRAIRAVACDSELATITGVNVERVRLWSQVLASGVAGIGAVLVASDVDMHPTMGMTPVIMGMIVCLLAGTTKTYHLAAGAVALSALQHGAAWTLGAEWKDPAALVLLLVLIAVKPYGLNGQT